MKNKTKVEILDEYMLLQESANDHQIRIIIKFFGKLDIVGVTQVIEKSFEYVPILSSRLQKTGNRYCWEKVNSNFTVKQFKVDGENSIDFLIQNCLAEQTDQLSGPQIKATVVQSEKKDVLVLVVNHMAIDGTGFKEYLALLCKLYNGMEVKKDEYRSNRNIYGILKHKERVKRKARKKTHDIALFLCRENDRLKSELRLFVHKIENTDFLKIVKFCKLKNVTINDYMITLFALSIRSLGYDKETKFINLDMMIDARRYDNGKSLSPFMNASSMETVSIQCAHKDNEKFLIEVHDQIDAIKKSLPGYKNLKHLGMLMSFAPRRLYSKILQSKTQHPNISTTNLGRLDCEDMKFCKSMVEDAFFVTAIKRNNSVQFTFSTFQNSITITTIGYYYSELVKKIEKIYCYFRENVHLSRTTPNSGR